ncbi:unnamed protein product [Sphagnum balticum]
MGIGGGDDEDWLRGSPSRTIAAAEDGGPRKRNRKIINIDDILLDDYKENVRKLKNKTANTRKNAKLKTNKSHLYESSDEDVDGSNAPEVVKDLEEQVDCGGATEEIEPQWGQRVFGPQKPAPELAISGDSDDFIKQALLTDAGESFAVKLLGGPRFLRVWALWHGSCDKATLHWAFHQMAFSKLKHVETAACKLLCDLLMYSNRDLGCSYKLDWVPSLGNVMETLQVYGYLGVSDSGGLETSTNSEIEGTSEEQGPPMNLFSLLKFLSVFIATRKFRQCFLTKDVERLLVTISHLLLDQDRVTLGNLIQSCLMTLVDSFTDEEWKSSCGNIAAHISRLTTEKHNGLHLVRGLCGNCSRMEGLQRAVAMCELSKCLSGQGCISSVKEVVASFESVHLKDKGVDFENVYYRIVLADITLWCNPTFQGDKGLAFKWSLFLKSCSLQIFSGDERPFATKVRNRSSLLWQKYEHDTDYGEAGSEGEVKDSSS